MSNGSYNYIYRELVTNENDILGIIAYSLYKRQKIEYIQGFKSRNGAEPSNEDLVPFHDISNSLSQLESYRNQASQLAQDFLDITLETQAEQLEKYYAGKAGDEIRNAKPGFWAGVAQSVVGSVLFVFLLGCLVFFTWSLNQGPKQVIEQVFDIQILNSRPQVDSTTPGMGAPAA